MRKSAFVPGLALILVATVTLQFTSCKSKKEAAPVVTPKSEGEVEIKSYCSGSEFFGTKDAFRANSVGESLDQTTSKRKALNDSRAQLAASIQSTIKATTDNYVSSREFNNKEEVLERFESLSREVVNQELTGARVICEKITKTQENKFKTYIAIELSAESLFNKVSEKLSKDERLRIDYDYEKFKDTFEKEMAKMETGRP